MSKFNTGDIVHRVRDEYPGTPVQLQREADEDEYSFQDLGEDETVWRSIVWKDSTVYPFHEEGKELIVRESNLTVIDSREIEDY